MASFSQFSDSLKDSFSNILDGMLDFLAASTLDQAVIKFVRNAFSCLSRCCPRLEIVTGVAAMAQQL